MLYFPVHVRFLPSADLSYSPFFFMCAFYRMRFFPSALFSHALIYICGFFLWAFFRCVFFPVRFFSYVLFSGHHTTRTYLHCQLHRTIDWQQGKSNIVTRIIWFFDAMKEIGCSWCVWMRQSKHLTWIEPLIGHWNRQCNWGISIICFVAGEIIFIFILWDLIVFRQFPGK